MRIDKTQKSLFTFAFLFSWIDSRRRSLCVHCCCFRSEKCSKRRPEGLPRTQRFRNNSTKKKISSIRSERREDKKGKGTESTRNAVEKNRPCKTFFSVVFALLCCFFGRKVEILIHFLIIKIFRKLLRSSLVSQLYRLRCCCVALID